MKKSLLIKSMASVAEAQSKMTKAEDMTPTTQGAASAAVLAIPTAIMELPCKPGRAIAVNGASKQAYQEGHRDARHAAADLVLERADAIAALAASPQEAQPQTMRETYAHLLEVQRAEAATGDPYMLGLYNGMSMMVANIDGDLSWEPMGKPAVAPQAEQVAKAEIDRCRHCGRTGWHNCRYAPAVDQASATQPSSNEFPCDHPYCECAKQGGDCKALSSERAAAPADWSIKLVIENGIVVAPLCLFNVPNLGDGTHYLRGIAAEGATPAGETLIEVLRKADDALRNSVAIVSGQQSWDRHNEARVALNKAIEELTHAR